MQIRQRKKVCRTYRQVENRSLLDIAFFTFGGQLQKKILVAYASAQAGT